MELEVKKQEKSISQYKESALYKSWQLLDKTLNNRRIKIAKRLDIAKGLCIRDLPQRVDTNIIVLKELEEKIQNVIIEGNAKEHVTNIDKRAIQERTRKALRTNEEPARDL